MDAAYWATQSPVTDPGPAAVAIEKLPADIAALRRVSSQLVFHYWANGDFAENGVPTARMAEIDTRYADAMLDLVLQRGDPALDRDRPPPERMVGCCRDATVFFLALARAKGIPARARVGFAAYLVPGWLCDHVIAEIWDAAEDRWRLVDPEMAAAWTPEVNGVPVDWLDLTEDQFMTGPRAWQAARDGTSDPERFVVTPDLDIPDTRGWPYIAHHVIHDLAALNKTEMLVWDYWGLLLEAWTGPLPDQDAAVIDDISAVTADPAADRETLARLGARDGLRIPPVITSIDPNGGPPRQVDVSQVLSAGALLRKDPECQGTLVLSFVKFR
jgi:AcrR family transcriptional regulator